jgi:hypothetical protein
LEALGEDSSAKEGSVGRRAGRIVVMLMDVRN